MALPEHLQTVICGSPGRTRVGRNRSLQRRAETRPAFDAAPLVVNRSGAGSTRDFSTDLPRKIYDLAWRTALSYRFRKGELIIVENAIEIETPSAPYLEHIFKLHERERGKGRSLLITGENF